MTSRHNAKFENFRPWCGSFGGSRGDSSLVQGRWRLYLLVVCAVPKNSYFRFCRQNDGNSIEKLHKIIFKHYTTRTFSSGGGGSDAAAPPFIRRAVAAVDLARLAAGTLGCKTANAELDPAKRAMRRGFKAIITTTTKNPC
mmetsp:Transcript_28370/g.47105  ORF Transcript_28370/g.47105 Transcript_28370/m.47105 type:complete len:141 (+) Transcript_28370:1142-1564(+)